MFTLQLAVTARDTCHLLLGDFDIDMVYIICLCSYFTVNTKL